MGHHRPRLITWTLLIKHNKISIAHLTNLQWMNPTTHDSTTVPDGPSKWVNHKPITKTGKQLWKKKRKKYINMNENQFTPLQKNPFPKSKCIDIWNTHKQNLRKQNTHNIHKSQNPSPATALPIIIPFPIFTTTATTSTWTQTHHAFNTKQIKTKTHLDCRLINQQEMRQAQEVKKRKRKRKRKMKNPKRKADGERKRRTVEKGKGEEIKRGPVREEEEEARNIDVGMKLGMSPPLKPFTPLSIQTVFSLYLSWALL